MARKTRFDESARANNSTYIQYLDRLTELAISMFEWKNLPDSVDERFLESVHNKGYAEMFLETLEHGYDDEKRALYQNEQEYIRKIKERLDKLDTVSRKSRFNRAI